MVLPLAVVHMPQANLPESMNRRIRATLAAVLKPACGGTNHGIEPRVSRDQVVRKGRAVIDTRAPTTESRGSILRDGGRSQPHLKVFDRTRARCWEATWPDTGKRGKTCNEASRGT